MRTHSKQRVKCNAPEPAEAELFAATLFHDLKAPLQQMACCIFLLSKEYKESLGEDGKCLLSSMKNSVSHLNHLIGDLMTFVKAEKKEALDETVDLNEVISTVVKDFQPIFKTIGASICVEGLPRVDGDSAQLRLVFQNLIQNAVKYRRIDAPLQISVKARPLHTKKTSDAPEWEVVVEDNGVGFRPEDSQMLFKPFYRLKNEGIEGTGLGLAICARIVKKHRGAIVAQGSPGNGACFAITLPSSKTLTQLPSLKSRYKNNSRQRKEIIHADQMVPA